jgi:tetratricopeptide (TPR) repeat protein
MCLGYQNNFSDAIGAFNQSVAISPKHTNSLVMLGKAYGIQGDYEKSKIYFEKVLTIDRSNQEALNNLNMTLEIIKSKSAQ